MTPTHDIRTEYEIVQLDDLSATRCPCGWARRAFVDREGGVASAHVVDILDDSRAHYHRRTTEIYVVLEGEGEIELNGERHPLRPLTAVYIPPGVRHRAIGKLRLLNIPIPPFRDSDEYFD
jgi:mannose-6-phosphate isomerase-like protein (cupin superfamily)